MSPEGRKDFRSERKDGLAETGGNLASAHETFGGGQIADCHQSFAKHAVGYHLSSFNSAPRFNLRGRYFLEATLVGGLVLV